MHILIGIVIAAALLIYAPRIVFVALGLGFAVGALFLAFIFWGPTGDNPMALDGHGNNCADHWRIGCHPAEPPKPTYAAIARAADANAKLPCAADWWDAKPGQPICPPPPPSEHLPAECPETEALLAQLPVPEQGGMHDYRMEWFNALPNAHQQCVLNRFYRHFDQESAAVLQQGLALDPNCVVENKQVAPPPSSWTGPNTTWFTALPAAQQICIRRAAFIALHSLPLGNQYWELASDQTCRFIDWTAQQMPALGPVRMTYISALPAQSQRCMVDRLHASQAAAQVTQAQHERQCLAQTGEDARGASGAAYREAYDACMAGRPW